MGFPVPSGWSVRTAASAVAPALSLAEAAGRALNHPVKGPPLGEHVRPGSRVTLVIPDLTRPSPDALFVGLLVDALGVAGVPPDRITLLVALGMHRPLTRDEIAGRLGARAAALRIVQAQGQDAVRYRDLGTLPAGEDLPEAVPVRIHEEAFASDLLLATGVVEPHQLAGYSGGRKTVGIGCAGEPTIRVLHGMRFLEHPGSRLGRLRDNPLHSALEAIAARARLAFVLNLAYDAQGNPVAVSAGEPAGVLGDLVARGAPYFWSRVEAEPFDAILAGVPSTKGSNLYQASRAFTYLASPPERILREGGWIVLPATLEEGIGGGAAEREFAAKMTGPREPAAVLADLRREGYGVGGQRAVLVARAQAIAHGMMVGANDAEGVFRCGFTAAAGPEAAIARLLSEVGPRARVLLVPNAFGGIPLPEGTPVPS